MTLNTLAERINKTSTAHGFWPTDRDDALSAFERIVRQTNGLPGATARDAVLVHRYIKAQSVRNMGEMLMLAVSELAEGLEEHRHGRPVHYIDNGKPEGLAVELADCIIRCLDTMHSLGVDIDAIVEEKMAYNDTRPYKHGRKF